MEDIKVSELLGLGDSQYVDEQYDEALTSYTAALTLLRDALPSSPSSASTILVRLLSHRSACFLKLDRHEESYDDATSALKCLSERPSLREGESEILHRRAGVAAMGSKRKWEDAKHYLEKALELATLNKSSSVKLYGPLIAECHNQLDKKSNPTPSSPSSSPNTAINSVNTQKSSLSSSSATAAATGLTMPKYQYYQNDKFMTVSILEANVRGEDLTVRFEPQDLTVVLRKRGKDFTVICGPLYSEIDVDKSKVVIKDEKVLVKLKKIEQFEWPELIDAKPDNSKKKGRNKTPTSAAASTVTAMTDSVVDSAASVGVSTEAAAAATGARPSETLTTTKSKLNRPYASDKDWDSIEKIIAEEEENETPQGDEAMNKLFRQIYANANEETRRAMVKSFQTSGGTVLSTNWDEVKDKDYEKERTAPDGVEWKTWDGDKLPMSDKD